MIPPLDPRRGYLNGYSVKFVRRRYGRQTYTWLWAKRDDDDGPMREMPCDPWPCASPKRAEVHAEVLRCLYGIPAGSPTGSDRTGPEDARTAPSASYDVVRP